MKGLLYKDLYSAWKYCRSYLLLTAVFTLVYLLGQANVFYLLYPCALVGTIPMSLVSYDEREHWDRFVLTLPITRSQIVVGKYLTGLILGAVTILPTTLAALVRMGLDGFIRWTDLLSILSSQATTSLTITAILLPCVFKFGAEKGRIAYSIVVGIACGLAALVVVGDGIAIALDMSWLVGLGPLAAGIFYLLSCRLSIRIYKKREL